MDLYIKLVSCQDYTEIHDQQIIKISLYSQNAADE